MSWNIVVYKQIGIFSRKLNVILPRLAERLWSQIKKKKLRVGWSEKLWEKIVQFRISRWVATDEES